MSRGTGESGHRTNMDGNRFDRDVVRKALNFAHVAAAVPLGLSRSTAWLDEVAIRPNSFILNKSLPATSAVRTAIP